MHANDWLEPDTHSVHPATRAWQAHLDAGRLGHGAAAAPGIAANRAATEALLRAPSRAQAPRTQEHRA